VPKLAGPKLSVSSAIDSVSTSVLTGQKIERPKQPAFASVTGTGSHGQVSDYLFVSNVRFLAMISIVWVHATYQWGRVSPPASYVQVILLQLMKFGTIGFFLISGYLLGEGLTRTSPRRYFYRRVNAVFVPWVFWSVVWFAIALSQDLLGENSRHHLESSLRDLGQLYLKFVFTQSIYWFVPNFFLCLAIVLGLHKRVPDYVQGIIFLSLSLFYGVNAYIRVIPSMHMSALFGFVFYLWLGSFAYRHREQWNRWMARTSWVRLATFAGVATILAIAEFHMLERVGADDSLNTLRISNQIYSVAIALLIVKSRRALFPRSLDVRTETFGIFLIHPILIEVFQIGYARVSSSAREGIRANGPLTILLGVATFVVLYLFSVLLTKQIRRIPSLRWMVGR
jgi:hypothetical protein